MPDTHYAFLDESSTLGSADDFFIVGILFAQPTQQKQLRRLPKKIRKHYLKKNREIKFHDSTPRIKKLLLEEIARCEVKIAIIAVAKEKRQIQDTPHTYGLVVGTIVSNYLRTVHPILDLTVDKRYTSSKNRALFEQVVRQCANNLAANGKLTKISHQESHTNDLLQLADFIAGAANKKYNRGDAAYLEIVKDKIVIERKVSWRELRGEFKTKKAANPERR